jgi:hypothetical protein
MLSAADLFLDEDRTSSKPAMPNKLLDFNHILKLPDDIIPAAKFKKHIDLSN